MTDVVKITQPAHELMYSDTLSKEEVHRILVTNSTSEFGKLRGVPGISVDPIPWNTASDLVKENTVESLARLGRSPEGIVEYWTFKEKVGHQFGNWTFYYILSKSRFGAFLHKCFCTGLNVERFC